MPKLTKAIVETWIETLEPNKSFHYKQAVGGQIDPESYDNLRKIFHDLKAEKKIASTGYRDGWYYKIEQIKPIKNIDGGGEDYLNLSFPRSHEDDDVSEFGFEDMLAVSPGDLLVIAGVSNSAKTTIVLNMLADNIAFPKGCLLMGNEYVTAERVVAPRFRRRLKALEWSPVITPEGVLKFELLPVKQRFENYIKRDAFNIVDWISMPTNFYEIQGIHEGIKESIGQGIAAVCMQKSRGKDYGDGGEFSERLSDFYITLNSISDSESVLTLGKVKETKIGAGRVSGQSWAFEVLRPYGVRMRNIRRVRKCPQCHGWSVTKGTKCDSCLSTGWIDVKSKEEF